MDPLTKKLMGRLGLTPGQSQLPPVNNLRMVTLQKDISEGEKDLHKARLRLQDLQAALENPSTNNQASIINLTASLHDAMYKLQAREQDYFAMTHFTGEKNKPILDGWTREGRQQQQLVLLDGIYHECSKHYHEVDGDISADALRVVIHLANLAFYVKKSAHDWYDHEGNRMDNPDYPTLFDERIEKYYTAAKKGAELVLASPLRIPSSKIAVKIAMQRAERLKRISQSIKHGQWTVPVDDISPITP